MDPYGSGSLALQDRFRVRDLAARTAATRPRPALRTPPPTDPEDRP
ncbi:hypothetical protein ABZ567_03870 [Streptomyces sp. NPDC016459]